MNGKNSELEAENKALKQILQQRTEECDKYKKLIDVSGDALSIINLDTGKFIECNQAAIEMHGVGGYDNFINLTPSVQKGLVEVQSFVLPTSQPL